METWLDELVAKSQLQVDDRVREALWARGVSDEQIEAFKIGYLNQALPELATSYPDHFLKWSKDGKKLVDGYVFPLTNFLGEIRGIQMRSVERGRQDYMDYFLDEGEPVYFGLGQAATSIWETEEILLVEGVFDFFPVQRVKPFTVSTLTAKVNETFARALKRLVQRVHLFYDDDRTGISGATNFEKEHGAAFTVRRVPYPRGVTLFGKTVKDPGDLWEAWGDDRLRDHLLSHWLEL